MKEIGGYFGLESLISKELYCDLIAVNSARNALAYLIKARGIKKLYIPSFLCDSVSKVCERENCEYEYYEIDNNWLPRFNKSLNELEYLYIVNYYGQLDNDELSRLHILYGNIIVDNVQAFFQKPLEGVDTLYSCRKFFGVPDGGYLSTEARISHPLSVDASGDRMVHVLGRFEKGASSYYDEFKHNEEHFEGLELREMSKLTHNILGAVDYDGVREQREKNYAILESAFSSINTLKLKRPIGPYAYPFYCKNGLELKRELAKKKIFVPTLWPDAIKFEGISKEYSENILPLPCDQRYTENDMQYMIEEIFKCLKS